MAVKVINNDNFKEMVLEEKTPVVIDFWAPWCGYCRRLGPLVERMAEQYEGKLIIGKLDIDESPELAEQFEVDTIPTLILFKDGKDSEPIVNPGSASEIEAWLEENGAL